ncbi:SAM-dependent chlorinase/fluorinase [Candidatus Micrarchaeota archaeon]|nr:SAM-dependent chlorinase/fluorinase [Candidatus Micrarchaeota archaeon]
MKLVSLASDFGVQTQGIAAMKGSILEICPDARIIDLMHGLPSYNLWSAARTMETACFLPKGAHVCVVDPGVGTKRKGIAIETKRGDFLVGPDNGVLMSAIRFFQGFERAVSIDNLQYARQPVSPIFHGRDVFSPAAAHLVKGVSISELGAPVSLDQLVPCPFPEAKPEGNTLSCRILHVNQFGSIHLNLLASVLDEWGVKEGDYLLMEQPGQLPIKIPFRKTFGDVFVGSPVLLKDDYGRVELAINQASFSEKFDLKQKDLLVFHRS